MAMAAVQLMNTSTASMAQHSAAAANATSRVVPASPHMFHDFLGVVRQQQEDHRSRPSGSSPAASASAGASLGGGRCGPISTRTTTSSDLGSAERQVGNPIEGVPFYGARSDVSGTEIIASNRLMRYKRSNSDSAFMGSAREYATLHTRPEVHDNLPLMKMLRTGLGGERPRQPPSTSLMLHHPRTIRSSRFDPRFVPSNVDPTLQFPLRGGPFMPPMQQPPNLYRDVHHHHVIGAPVASSADFDEGSRTGFKTPPGILNSIHIAGGGSEKYSSMSLGKSHSGTTVNTNPKCSNPTRIDPASLVGRQMTIFYGGQAHVFDEVSPTKAELIMTLASSSGGSWSTASAPKSTSSSPSSTAPPQDPRQQIPGSSQRSIESTDRRFSNTTVGLPRSILGKDARSTAQVADDGEKKCVNEE